MTFAPNIVSTKKPRSFKLRGEKKKTERRILYGDTLIYFAKEGGLDLTYFKFLKKKLKLLFKWKLHKASFLKKKIWFFVNLNFPVTKKSKNARMGKGKGSFVRWRCRIKQNAKFFETKHFSRYRLHYFLKKLQPKTTIPLKVYRKTVEHVYKITPQNVSFWFI